MKRFITKFLKGFTVFFFWLGVWYALSLWVQKEVLLPSPLAVGKTLLSLATTSEYWLSIGASLLRVLLGFVAGCGIGLLLALLCFRFSLANALISPVLSIVRSVPVASFIILALVWIGRSYVPSFSAFLMVLPILTGNTVTGLRSADPALLEVCKVYRIGMLSKLSLVYLPALRPYFLSAARTALGLAWKAGVAAEVLSSLSASIGGGIYESKLYLETPSLFAWTITVIGISMLLELLLFSLSVFHKRRDDKEVVA